MEYVDILSTALSWYAIGGVAILIGSAIVYGFALLIYRLLAHLGALIRRSLAHLAARVDVARGRHHPAR
jgi:hypothetical protein